MEQDYTLFNKSVNDLYNVFINDQEYNNIPFPQLLIQLAKFVNTNYSTPEINKIKSDLLSENLKYDSHEYLQSLINFIFNIKDLRFKYDSLAARLIELFDILRCCSNEITVTTHTTLKDFQNNQYKHSKSRSQLKLVVKNQTLDDVMYKTKYSNLLERIASWEYINSCNKKTSTLLKENLYTIEETEYLERNRNSANDSKILVYHQNSFNAGTYCKAEKNVDSLMKLNFVKTSIENIIKTSLMVEEFFSLYNKDVKNKFYIKFKISK